MKKETFKELSKENLLRKSEWSQSLLLSSRVLFLTLAALFISTSPITVFWLFGQILLGIAILQWFVLLHDFGHNCFFPNKKLNLWAGYFASLFCWVPFYPWKQIHTMHHVWTGWQDRDPTMESTLPRPRGKAITLLARICWRLWIPVLSLGFSFHNFWNLPRLWRLFPEPKERIHFLFSTLGLAVFLIAVMRSSEFWHFYGLGYLIFLIIADPLLISQHSHVPQMLAKDSSMEVLPVPVYEQELYTRTLQFPNWMGKYILLNFDAHSAHHLWPTLPCYHLGKIKVESKFDAPWLKWLYMTKKLPIDRILFSSRKDTGWQI
jgi:fatty acid desaturase